MKRRSNVTFSWLLSLTPMLSRPRPAPEHATERLPCRLPLAPLLSGVYDGEWKGADAVLENVCSANDHPRPIRVPRLTGHSASPRTLCLCPHASLMRPLAPNAY